jgi:recombination protein RecT
VVSIHCDIVCKGDIFKTSLGVVVEHEPNYQQDAGEVYAVYATAKLKDGSSQSVVLRKSEVEAIRKRSRSGSSGPWTTDWNEMAKKTAFKRLSKWLPLASEAMQAIEYDNRKEFGSSTIDVTPQTETAPTAAKILAQPKPAKRVKKAEPTEVVDEPLEVDDNL